MAVFVKTCPKCDAPIFWRTDTEDEFGACKICGYNPMACEESHTGIESKWLIFEWDSSTKSKKTKIWSVTTKETHLVLGYIKWFGAWRGYAFFPFDNTIFEKQCLRDIANFIEEENKLHRQSWKKNKC